MRIKTSKRRLKVEGDVGFDAKYYHRLNPDADDWPQIHERVDALKADPEFDMAPITVVRWSRGKLPFMLIDGLYRLRAYHAAGRTRIPATVVSGVPQSQWFQRGVEIQMKYQFLKRLDPQDKAYIATKLQAEYGWTIAQAAALLRVTPGAMQKMVAKRAVPLTAGQAVPLVAKGSHEVRRLGGQDFGFLKAPFTESNGSPAVVNALAEQAPVAATGPLQVLDSFLALLRSGCLDMADQAVKDRVSEIKRLLP